MRQMDNKRTSKDGGESRNLFDGLQIFQRFQDPMMRWGDVPGSSLLAELRMLDPGDAELRNLHELVEQDQLRKALISGDPFYGNPPPAGSLPHVVPGRIPLAALATGDVLSIAVEDLMRNVLVVGPTGSGKTNMLRVLIAAVLESCP